MKRRGIVTAISLLAIGFAAVSTTLIINGGARIIADQDNFDIYFSEAVLDNVSSPYLISEDKKTITYTTKDLKVAGETSVLDYVVTNSSTQYDAEVEINCTPSSTEYLTITNEMDADIIKASTSEAGALTVKLNKNATEAIETEFTCTIVANAIERDTVSEGIEDSTLYAYMKNNVGNYGINLLSETESEAYPVYYYTAKENNNVLFANFCWQIVRTTDTGGVKLIYNGEPDENGSCDNTGSATQLSSTSAFNRNYTSPADVGYMYNTRYTYNSRSMTSSQTVVSDTLMSSTTSYYYSDTYNYTSSRYYMDNPEQLEWGSNYENLEGKYTCRSTSSNGYCSSIYYIVKVDSSRMYHLKLSSGNDLSDVSTTLTLGSDYTDNGDGTYTLIDTIEVDKADWYSNYTSYRNYYVCGTNNTTTCSNLRYITSSSNTSYTYVNLVNEYLYGNSFTYDSVSNTYTLVDTKGIWNWSTGYNTINNNHYTCFNTTGICNDEIYYVYYTNSSSAYYIRLSDGKTVETALEEMLSSEDVNKYDSTIKGVIDSWYEANMTKYTDYLEDTVWCNDRSISSLNGWNPNGGSITSYLLFRSYSNFTDLSCPNKIDSFTVNESEHGNGALDYPVGLLTYQEAYLMGSSARTTGSYYWLLSPNYFTYGSADGNRVYSSGGLGFDSVDNSNGVRPAVSLNPGTEYASGDGSVDNPFVVG